MAIGTAAAIIGGSLISGFSASRASKRAAEAQQAGIDQSIAEQRRQFDLNRADLAPFRETATGALGRLSDISEGDLSGFFTSPGFGFVREEGLRGIENRFAARGGAQSGNALRRLAEFNTGLASQEFGNFFNRQLNLAGLGASGVQAGVQAGTQISGNIANALQRGGDVRASGILGQNEALQGTLGNLLFAQGAGIFDPRTPPINAQNPRPGIGGR